MGTRRAAESAPLTTALALLLLLVPAAAGVGVSADLVASQAQGQGATRLDAPLVGLLQPVSTAATPLPSGFLLEAQEIRVETDRANVTLVLSDTLAFRPLPTTSTERYAQSTVEGTGGREGFRMDVLPASPGSARVEIEAPCAQLHPPEDGSVVRQPLVQDDPYRPDVEVDTAQSVRWEGCSQATPTAVVAGDFWFSAWEVDFRVTDGEGTHDHWSGHGDGDVVVEDRELFVYVADGVMHVPLAPDSGYGLFVGRDVDLSVDGSLRLDGATGQFPVAGGPMEFEGDVFTANGNLDLHVEPRTAASPFPLVLRGDADEARLNGGVLPLATPAPAGGVPWAVVAPLALALAAAALVAATVHRFPLWLHHQLWSAGDPRLRKLPRDTPRQRRAALYGRYSDQAITNAHHVHAEWRSQVVAWWARIRAQRAHRLDPSCRVYLVWISWAYAQLGRDRKALQVCRHLDGVLRGRRNRAKNAWLAAQCSDALGLEEETRAWLLLAEEYHAWTLLRGLQHFLDDRAPMARKAWVQQWVGGLRERSGLYS